MQIHDFRDCWNRAFFHVLQPLQISRLDYLLRRLFQLLRKTKELLFRSFLPMISFISPFSYFRLKALFITPAHPFQWRLNINLYIVIWLTPYKIQHYIIRSNICYDTNTPCSASRLAANVTLRTFITLSLRV